MATGLEIEQLAKDLASGLPALGRKQVKEGLDLTGTGLTNLVNVKTRLDTVVADAASAGQDDYSLAQVQADWASNLSSTITASFSYSGKTSINALAQLIADLSEQAGLEGGANELRLYRNGTVVAVDQDA